MSEVVMAETLAASSAAVVIRRGSIMLPCGDYLLW
jgi:hypothetical protein